MVKSHKDLQVWQLSVQFVKTVYELTAYFPKEEQFGLVSQMRRAAVSVPSNIAEGAGRSGKREWIRFLYISLGSLSELETQLEIAKLLQYTTDISEEIAKLIHIRRMLNNLITSLNS